MEIVEIQKLIQKKTSFFAPWTVRKNYSKKAATCFPFALLKGRFFEIRSKIPKEQAMFVSSGKNKFWLPLEGKAHSKPIHIAVVALKSCQSKIHFQCAIHLKTFILALCHKVYIIIYPIVAIAHITIAVQVMKGKGSHLN